MSTYFQIVAKTETGADLLWDKLKSNFVDFRKQVPRLTVDDFSDEWDMALDKAQQELGIERMVMEEIDIETEAMRGIVAFTS